MSWDAYLETDDDYIVDQNYTHNCNRMIATVLEECGWELEEHWLIGHMGKSWFRILDDMSSEDGARLLKMIVFGLEKDPERFRAMNPSNGWGDYDQLLEILRNMRDRSLENPTAKWRVSG